MTALHNGLNRRKMQRRSPLITQFRPRRRDRRPAAQESHPRPQSAASTRHSLSEWKHVTRSVRLLEVSASRNRKQFAPATQEQRPHSMHRLPSLNRHAAQVDEQRIIPHPLKDISPVRGLTGISHRAAMFLLIKHGSPITARPGRKRDRLGFEMSPRQKECFPLSAPTSQEIERMSLKGR